MIAEKEISFNEIVKKTGKAKSTISVHLHDLEQAGLIRSMPDPNDYRQKIISISSPSIGRLTNQDWVSAGNQNPLPGNGLPFTEGDISSFFQFMFTTIRTVAMKNGINTDPILHQAGYQIGSALVPLITGITLADKIKKLDQFWRTYGLGTITLLNKKPISLLVEGCFECNDLPTTGHNACSFDTGVFGSSWKIVGCLTITTLFVQPGGGRAVGLTSPSSARVDHYPVFHITE